MGAGIGDMVPGQVRDEADDATVLSADDATALSGESSVGRGAANATGSGAQVSGTPAGPATQASGRAWDNREFRGVAAAQLTSECGDQIAAIALSFLIYNRSHSAFFAAATYAVTYVPWVVGSVVLSPLVDRLSRRRIMLVCDVARAAITGLLAVLSMFDGIPIAVLIALVFVSSCFMPPFAAARGALLPDIFEAGPGYVSAVAIGRILQQLDQVFGFALGGIIVGLVSPSGALSIDAGTFLVSFAFTAVAVRERPVGEVASPSRIRSLVAEVGPNLRLVLRSRTRRAMLTLSAGALLFMIAPEGLAVAYAREQGRGAVAVGLLTAAEPFGVAVGAWLFIKYVPARLQGRCLLPLASGAACVLALTAFVPPVWLACVLWALAGVCQCFLITTIAAYNIATDRALRGRANGIAAAAISVTQGLGFLIWGAVGNWLGAPAGVAWAGVAGLFIMAFVRFGWPVDEIEEAWDQLDAAQRGS